MIEKGVYMKEKFKFIFSILFLIVGIYFLIEAIIIMKEDPWGLSFIFIS